MLILRNAIILAISLGIWAHVLCPLRAESVVVVLLDDSGSMNDEMKAGRRSEPRMAVAKRALKKLVLQLPEDTQLGLLLMNGSSESDGWLVPLGKLNRQTTLARIDQVSADGGTPLGGSMKIAMNALLEYRKEQPIGDYRLLVVTDGEATDPEVLQSYLPAIVSRGVFIDVIGVDMQTDHSLARRSHSYRRADDERSLERALTEVFAESSVSDNKDTAQADFDLISGLPDELAQQALAALVELQGQPIDPEDTGSDANAEGALNSGTGQSTSGTPVLGSWVCSFACLAFLLVVVLIVVSLIGKIVKK